MDHLVGTNTSKVGILLSVRRQALAFSVALAALVAAVGLRWLLDPVMGVQLPLVTLFGAVAVAVWVGGYQPALMVAVLGYLACSYLFIEPRGFVFSGSVAEVVGLVAYLFTCGLIIGIGEAMRAARNRAGEREELMRVTLGSIGDAVITTDTDGARHLSQFSGRIADRLDQW